MKAVAGTQVTFHLLDEKDYPLNRWCKSGHVAALTVTRPDGTTAPMTFAHVYGKTVSPSVEGVYCEECLAKANKTAVVLRKMRTH